MAEARKTPSDIAEEIATLRADLARLTETVGTLLGQEAEEFRSQLKERAEEIGERGRAYAARARAEAGAYEREAEDLIVRNPITAVLMAAGLGFVFGLLTRGR